MPLSPTPAFRLLPHEDPILFQAHLAALLARHTPVDEAERHQVELLAACAWRQRRLLALETRAIEALDNPPDEDAPPLPSLATLARYGARIERDLRTAREELERLRQARPRLTQAELARGAADRLRWLVARKEESVAAPTNDSTPEPEPAPAPAAAHASPSAPAAPAALNRAARRRLARQRRTAAA